jgi:TPR repeat protein
MAQKFGELLKAAENGNADAMFQLSKCYQSGDGIAKDTDKAEEWLRKAAERGNVKAQQAAAQEAERQQTAPAPAEPFDLIGTIWTRFDLGESIEGKSGFMHTAPKDWEFKECGVLFDHKCPKNKNSWVQNGNSVTVKYNKNFATYELKIINPKLMQGTLKNIEGYKGPVELRRK